VVVEEVELFRFSENLLADYVGIAEWAVHEM